jgi:hypothetical protein
MNYLSKWRGTAALRTRNLQRKEDIKKQESRNIICKPSVIYQVNYKGEEWTLAFLMNHYNAIPGIGFLGGIGETAFGFMGLGPGAGARRALTWLAEFERGRPICGGGMLY